MLSDLDQIENGDVFYIKVLNRTLAYQVDQILTVLPTETQALAITEGADQVTMVTCTPYAINTHRLLIRGSRIPYEEAVGGRRVRDQTADTVDPEDADAGYWSDFPGMAGCNYDPDRALDKREKESKGE